MAELLRKKPPEAGQQRRWSGRENQGRYGQQERAL